MTRDAASDNERLAAPGDLSPRPRLRARSSRGGVLLPAALLLLALVPLGWVALSHAVDVPGYDQINWNIVDLVEAGRTGRWSWATFFTSHNEHQLLFTKLLILLNAWGFDWVRPLDSAVCAVVIGGASLAFALWARARHGTWAAVSVVLVMASVNQWRNVTWGFMLQHGMVLLFAVCLALYSERETLRAGWLACLALLGTAASGNGLVLWVIGGLLLALQARRTRQTADAAGLVAFTAVAAATVVWVLSTAHGPQTAGPSNLWTFIRSLATVVANPVGYLVRWGALRAAIGLAVSMAGACLLWIWLQRELQHETTAARALRPLAVVVLFALGSATLIALRRDGEMLFDVKYNTSVDPLYAALSIGALMLRRSGVAASGRGFSVVITSMVCAAGLLSLNAAAQAERHDRANAVADYVQAMAGPGGLLVSRSGDWRAYVHPDGATQMQRLDRLGLLRPSLTRFRQALQDQLMRLPQEAPPPLGLRVEVAPDPALPVLGVEGSPGVDSRGQPPDAVLLVVMPAAGLPTVTVEQVANPSRRDRKGPWWQLRPPAVLSGRYQVDATAGPVERVALVAVWLDTLQMKALAVYRGPALFGPRP